MVISQYIFGIEVIFTSKIDYYQPNAYKLENDCFIVMYALTYFKVPVSENNVVLSPGDDVLFCCTTRTAAHNQTEKGIRYC